MRYGRIGEGRRIFGAMGIETFDTRACAALRCFPGGSRRVTCTRRDVFQRAPMRSSRGSLSSPVITSSWPGVSRSARAVSGVTYSGSARFPASLRSVHDMTIDGLEISGSSHCVLGSSLGSGSQRVMLVGLHLHDCGDAGSDSDNPLEGAWTIERSEITHHIAR
jgi:hypothetical protein